MSSHEGDFKTEAGLTQDSRQQSQNLTKPSKKIKRKNLQKTNEKKMSLNFKTNNSTIKKRRKKRSSKSKRRNSVSKNKNGDELHRSSVSKQKYHRIKGSLSPSKDFDLSQNQMKAPKPSQNYSKSNISIQNQTKRSRSKKKVRLNKVKSSKLLIKKEKIKNSSSGKTKRSSKSPRQINDAKYQTIEIIKNFDKKLQSSPNLILDNDTQDTPLMKTKEIMLKSNNDDDFLAFVEKQEIMHQKNKELS